MNRHFLVLGVLSLSTLAGALACSGAPTGPNAPGEAPGSAAPAPSRSADAATDPPPPDASALGTLPSATDAGSPATQPDTPLPSPTGTLLAAGSGLELDGITDDGFVVYSHASNVLATPLAGGPAVLVRSDRAGQRVEVSGSAVFTWSLPLLPNIGEELDVWTSAGPGARLSSNALAMAPIAASADGAKAAFFSRAGLVVSNLDGTGALSLGPLCATALAFDAIGDLVTTNCPASLDDAGAEPPSSNLSVYAAPGFERSLLSSDTSYRVDPAGSWVWVVDADAGGKLVKASDGSTAFSDALARGPAFFDGAGTTLFYLAGGAIKGLSLTSPTSAATLVASEVEAILALSPDGKRLVYSGVAGAVFVQSTDGAAPATQIDSFPNAAYAFTSDSANVVSVQAIGGGMSRYIAKSVHPTVTLAIGTARSATPIGRSGILVVDGSKDGHVLDLSGKTPTVDVPRMGAFVVSKDRTHFAYVAAGGAEPGLYAVSTLTEGATDAGSQLH